MATDTWGPPSDGWPSFCGHCGKRKSPEGIHTCPVPDLAGRDVGIHLQPGMVPCGRCAVVGPEEDHRHSAWADA